MRGEKGERGSRGWGKRASWGEEGGEGKLNLISNDPKQLRDGREGEESIWLMSSGMDISSSLTRHCPWPTSDLSK